VDRGSDAAAGNDARSHHRDFEDTIMTPGDLELFSTDELIDELMSRSTFQGVVVHSRDEAKNRDWIGERIFNLRHNTNLDLEQAGRLLDVIRQHIETEP